MNRIAPSFATVAALAAAAALAGCSASEDDPAVVSTITSLATAPAGDLTVELLTRSRLETARTPVFVRVSTAAGRLVADAAVTVTPIMTMTSGSVHGAPVLGAPVLRADGLYACEVVFQMASSDMGAWSAKVGIARPGAPALEAVFPSLTVHDTGYAKAFAYTDPATGATTKYVASLNLEAPPRVGLNPVAVTLHRMVDMMTFAPVDDAALALDPQMPSMGHGSPGSVDPTLASPGVYRGQLGFSMAGAWETAVTVSRGGAVVGAPRFATSF